MESMVFFFWLPAAALLVLGLAALSEVLTTEVDEEAGGAEPEADFSAFLDLSRSSRRFSCSRLLSDFSDDFFFGSFSSDE